MRLLLLESLHEVPQQGGTHDERQFIMARTKGPSRKSVTVGLSEVVYKAADEQRWAERMTFSEFVNHAVREYLIAQVGMEISTLSPEEPAEPGEAPEAEKAKKA